MKKRFLATFAATLVMTLSMSSVVMAAPSSSAQSAAEAVTATPAPAAEKQVKAAITLPATGATEATVKAAFEAAGPAKTASGAEIKVEKTTVEELNLMAQKAQDVAKGAQLLSVAEYSISPDTFVPGENIALNVEGVKAGDNILVIHHAKSGIEYIKPSSIKDGKIVFAINSFSPIAIVKLPADVNAGIYARAAQTGETNSWLILALAALAGSAVLAKAAGFVKSNESNS